MFDDQYKQIIIQLRKIYEVERLIETTNKGLEREFETSESINSRIESLLDTKITLQKLLISDMMNMFWRDVTSGKELE